MTDRSNAGSGAATFVIVVVVVAALYFAREVFIPLALAVLFSFLLAPLVVRARRLGLRRVPSVLGVVALAFLVVAVAGALVVTQLTELGRKLPDYEKNITVKLHALRDSSSGLIGRVTRITHDFAQEFNSSAPTPGPEGQKPVPVEIRGDNFSPLQVVRAVLGSLINILLTTAIVVVFVIFMLLEREDLRDRFIRLVGSRRLDVTVRALDEVGSRVSRYLLSLSLVNMAYGVLAGTGLFFLRVPNPVLWAVLATLLRFVPYLGIWIAAAMPAAVAFAVEPGWAKSVSIFGLYFGIDLLMYNFVEPVVYGNSAGMTPVAILVAAVFWTWLWGPVGLLMATPLTVCVAVVGRYVPSLRFLGILLSDEPVLSPEQRLYRRLLAFNGQEAAAVAHQFRAGKTPEEYCDRLIRPTLSLAESDRHARKLSPRQRQFVLQNLRRLAEAGFGDGPDAATPATQPGILLLPARDEADEIAVVMLAQLLAARGLRAKALPARGSAAGYFEDIDPGQARVLCVCAVPPSTYMHARYLCSRLRAQFPEARILAAILNGGDARRLKEREPLIPADQFATSFSQAAAQILSLAREVTPANPHPPALSA